MCFASPFHLTLVVQPPSGHSSSFGAHKLRAVDLQVSIRASAGIRPTSSLLPPRDRLMGILQPVHLEPHSLTLRTAPTHSGHVPPGPAGENLDCRSEKQSNSGRCTPLENLSATSKRLGVGNVRTAANSRGLQRVQQRLERGSIAVVQS